MNDAGRRMTDEGRRVRSQEACRKKQGRRVKAGRKSSFILHASSFVIVLLVCAVGAWLAQASPDSDLPPRPRPTPTTGSEPRNRMPTAYIRLTLPEPASDLWGVVQWQDSAGGWHDVDGWSGTLTAGEQVWGIFGPEFGRGPFRWLITQGPAGAALGETASFNLPASDGETLEVKAEVRRQK